MELVGGKVGPGIKKQISVLLELMRFDFSGDLVSKMEEHERAVLTFRNVSDESVSSAIEFGMVLNRLGGSERERHDFKAEVINISRARAVGAGAHTLAGKNNSHPGTQPMDVDAVSKGWCLQGPRQRITNLSHLWGNLET